MDYASLKTELTDDPLSLGYSTFQSEGSDSGQADLLNSLTGQGAATITLAVMDNASFVTAFLPYLPAIFTLSAAKQAFYTAVWNAILLMPTIRLSNGNVSGLMSQAVADGILTGPQAQALTQRTGSRAEVLFGQDTVIQHADISRALRG